jgi:hypothetical protein
VSDELDALIRQGKAMETRIDRLIAELSRLRQEIALRLGEHGEYHGTGVVAKKSARTYWDINLAMLLDELPDDVLERFKEVVFTKDKLDWAVKAGYVSPSLYDRAVRRVQHGWNISLKVLETPGSEPDRPPRES